MTALRSAGYRVGESVARLILARHVIDDVRVVAGEDDLYAPMQRRIELSRDRVDRGSTASAAVAAHEAAHALEHAQRSLSSRLRFALAIPSTPASLGWLPAAIAAAVLGSDALAAVAFALFGFTAAMSALTTWNEVDASRRALRELRAPGLDERGARRVLVACGATYVADTVLDIGFVSRRLRRDDEPGSNDVFDVL